MRLAPARTQRLLRRAALVVRLIASRWLDALAISARGLRPHLELGLDALKQRSPAEHWRRARLWIVTGSMALVAIGCAASLAGIAMAREHPGWWQRAEPDAVGAHGIALAVENGFVNHVYSRRDALEMPASVEAAKGVWRVALTADEANAWLKERLPAWFEHTSESWPEDLGEIRVRFAPGRIDVGASVLRGDRFSVITVSLTPIIDEHGSLWLSASSVRVGALPVPMSWLLGDAKGGAAETDESWLGRADGAQTEHSKSVRHMPEAAVLREAFSGRGPIVKDATVRLEDGRRVALLSVVPERDRLILTCRTK